MECKQVAPMSDKLLEVGALVEVQSTGQTGEDQPQTENVGQWIMVLQLVFPGNVTRQVDGPLQRYAARANLGAHDFLVSLANQCRAALFAEDFDRRPIRLLDASHCRNVP